ncbi:hypothetical protein [Streptomyces sp. NPDC004284]|uniref:hypothetical protein n=1 Tax=Streptomyces sp. NPDC004284 TaxID=3364695 RepID=UPI0036749752
MENTAEDAHALQWICTELADVRRRAGRQGWSAELEQSLAELRSGTRPAAAVLEPVRSRLGLPARTRGFFTLQGQEPALPPAGSYRCPGGRCGRVAPPREPGGPLPECGVFDEPFSFG